LRVTKIGNGRGTNCRKERGRGINYWEVGGGRSA